MKKDCCKGKKRVLRKGTIKEKSKAAEGHKEGFEAGKAEGVEAGQELIQAQVQTFVDLANQFAQPLELLNVQVEKQIS